MEQLSLFEKFQILFDNIFEHPLFIVILLVPAIMFLLQKKHGKKGFVLVYLLVIIAVLLVGGEVIFELFDNLMDGLFMTLYFPNFITLFVVVVMCSIIALFSFFSKKMYKVNKIINITGFAIIQMLFLLILSLVKAKNINIYADNALYSNSDVLTLMQLLIGTFTLQVIAILIINGINKVTDILDKRSTPLAEEIGEQITDLEKTKKTSLIKNIEIDNTKVGYINVADKRNTSKPKLKPFTFDVDKLESITLNVPEIEFKAEPLEKVEEVSNVESLGSMDVKPLENVKEFSEEKPLNPVDTSLNIKPEKSILPRRVEKKSAKGKKVVLPKERSKPIKFLSKAKSVIKPDLLKSFDDTKNKIVSKGVSKVSEGLEKAVEVKPNLMDKTTISSEPKFVNKKIQESNTTLEKPDLLKPDDSLIKVFNEVPSPKLVHDVHEEPLDLVDNLNILDIQSTLDTVIKYRLMKWVNLETYNDKAAVDNLEIPNFNFMVSVLSRCKLYKRL